MDAKESGSSRDKPAKSEKGSGTLKRSVVLLKRSANLRNPLVRRLFSGHKVSGSRDSQEMPKTNVTDEPMECDSSKNSQDKKLSTVPVSGSPKTRSTFYRTLPKFVPPPPAEESSESECEFAINSWADVVNALKMTLYSPTKGDDGKRIGSIKYNSPNTNYDERTREYASFDNGLVSVNWDLDNPDDNEIFFSQPLSTEIQRLSNDPQNCHTPFASSSPIQNKASQSNESLKRKRVQFKLPAEVISTDANDKPSSAKPFRRWGADSRYPKRFKSAWAPIAKRAQCRSRTAIKQRYRNTYDTETETEDSDY